MHFFAPLSKEATTLEGLGPRGKLVGYQSGVAGESEERIQITRRDQRRSQPTATLRGSVVINASGTFARLGRSAGEVPTRASYSYQYERGKAAERER